MEILRVYLPQDRLQALAQGQSLPEHTYGAAFLADLAGFTTLSETLNQRLGSRQGAENLTQLLNQLYDTLITEVERYRGSVIDFSGDAITCWFEGEGPVAAPRAVACGLAILANMENLARLVSTSEQNIALSLKVGVAVGSARRLLVGDPRYRYFEVLTGATLERMAVCERLALQGELVIGPEVRQFIGERLEVAGWRGTSNDFAVVSGFLDKVEAITWPPLPPHLPSGDELRKWILDSVYERIQTGQGSFLAELRPVVALFLSFSGLYYDSDEHSGQKLNAYICQVQHIVAHFGGTLLQLTIGDKGNFLYIAFGAPLAHEDNGVRAVRTGAALLDLVQEFDWLRQVQIGISQGMMRCGAYGGATRRTYGVIGEEANLAARLMQVAEPGQLLASGRVKESTLKEGLTWESLGELLLRGRREPIPVYRLLKISAPLAACDLKFDPNPSNELKLVGRSREQEIFRHKLDLVAAGSAREVLLIEGEAGIGKSRLVRELVQESQLYGLNCLVSSAEAVVQNVPYYSWQGIFSHLLSLNKFSDPTKQTEHVLELLQADPTLLRLAPLLTTVLPLSLEPNEFTTGLKSKEQAEKTMELLVGLLSLVGTGRNSYSLNPLVIVLDDAHWLDSASWALAEQVHQLLPSCLLVLVMRPLIESHPAEYSRFVESKSTYRLYLENLGEQDINQLICQRLGVVELPKVVRELIRDRAQGNPFFSEELAYSLRDAQLIEIRDGQCWLVGGEGDFKSIEFPDTVQGVITSRIDRLAPMEQLTLKVASVIGRIFGFGLLHAVYPIESVRSELPKQLKHLQTLDITPLEREKPELTYIFKHIITQEVVYSLMLFSQRRQLHRLVAEWYEQTYANKSTNFNLLVGLLATHYYQAQVWEKALYYLVKAGDAAANLYVYAEAHRSYTLALEVLSALPNTLENRRYYVDLSFKKFTASLLFEDPDQTIDQLKELESFLEELPGPDGKPGSDIVRLARLHYLLGRTHFLGNRLKEAATYYRQVLAVGKELDDEELVAIPSDYVGRLLHIQGRYREAEVLLTPALEWWAKTGNWADWLITNVLLGAVLALQGHYRPGIAMVEAGLVRAKEFNSSAGLILSYLQLAGTNFFAGEYDITIKAANSGIELLQQFSQPVYSYLILLYKVWALSRLNRHESTAQLINQIKEILGDLKGQVLMADRWISVQAEIAYNCGQYETALKLSEEAVAAALIVKNIATEAHAQQVWGMVLLKLHPEDRAAAEAHLVESIELNEQGPAAFDAARVRISWARDYYEQGEKVKAAELLRIAVVVYREAGLPASVDLPHQLLAELGI